MDESEKAFACDIEGCQMSFNDEDQLNWHQKKHDMVLNLGVANTEIADQTPTPTRFIRNCEEVGLFQDLQNVNPFDETFKKAIESAKTGSLLVPEANNDDSLHTPHIFPHVIDKYIRSESGYTPSNGFSISNDSNNEDIIQTAIEIKSEQINLKDRLKESIINKTKSIVVITPPIIQHTLAPAKKPRLSLETNQNQPQDTNKEKIREMNRVAQLRCRIRKKAQWKNMLDEIKVLKNDNTKLTNENQTLRHKLYSIKELLISRKKDNLPILDEIEALLSTTTIQYKEPTMKPLMGVRRVKSKPAPPKGPIPILQNMGQIGPKPVLIQVVGSVSQLAVSVLPQK